MTTNPPQPSVEPGVFEAIVAHVVDALVFADRDGVIRVWNAGAEALFGFSATEVAGSSLDVMIPERFRAAHWNAYRSALERGRTAHGGQVRTTRATHKDGRRLYVDMSFAVVTGPDGAVIGSVAMARDATQRHLAQAAR